MEQSAEEGRGSLIDRWLLNVAWMTLGGPPPDAPKDWIIPESILKSDADIGRFHDVAMNVGLTKMTHSGGSIAEDFDGDGYFDLVVSSSGPLDQLRYYHNDGDGTFTDQTHAAGLDGEVGGLNIIHADYNNDGWPDILVLRGGWWGKFGNYPCSLLRNNGPDAHGQITFTDVTEAAGLLSAHPTQTAAWADYDNDGNLDLMLGHETSVEDPYPSELFHNNGDGTFTNVAEKVGLADCGFVKGVAWGDFNNDGQAIFTSREKANPICFSATTVPIPCMVGNLPTLRRKRVSANRTKASLPTSSITITMASPICWWPVFTSIRTMTFQLFISGCRTKRKFPGSITTMETARSKT